IIKNADLSGISVLKCWFSARRIRNHRRRIVFPRSESDGNDRNVRYAFTLHLFAYCEQKNPTGQDFVPNGNPKTRLQRLVQILLLYEIIAFQTYRRRGTEK